MKVKVGVEGLDALLEELARHGEQAPAAVGQAVHAEALAVQALAVEKCPVDTGRLRASAYTKPPELSGDQAQVEVGFNTSYALAVHERTEAVHQVGEAKFLEKAINQRAPGWAARVAKRALTILERK